MTLGCLPTELSPNTLDPRGYPCKPSAHVGYVCWMDGWKPKSKPYILQRKGVEIQQGELQ